MFMLIFRMIPRLIAGILYIVLASKLYTEYFSSKVIKVLGWIVLAMELSDGILFPALVGFEECFYSLADVIYLLFVISLFLYTSVVGINTLEEQEVEKYAQNTEEM